MQGGGFSYTTLSMMHSIPPIKPRNAAQPPHRDAASVAVKPPAMRALYPPITPYSTGFLSVDERHMLYWEQSGNPDGVPILYLHGGPGGSVGAVHRQFFDPEYYRIIIFEQRGAGRSSPTGCTIDNTTAHLVADIETLRAHLNVDKWHIFGGSWGSTLGMAYAIHHHEHCLSMILRGIFLCEHEEIDWFLHGMGTIFPEAYDNFIGILDGTQRQDILTSYYDILMNDDDPETQMQAAIRWSLYESACCALIPNYETITTDEQRSRALSIAKIEAHYFKTQVFTGDERILNHIDTLRRVPTTIIQGRYDIICPIKTAHKLHIAWPEADYIVVPDGGHSALDPPIRSQLVIATDAMKTLKRKEL